MVCLPGFDGGLAQEFLLEVVGGTLLETTGDTIDITDNEISTMNDQVRFKKKIK